MFKKLFHLALLLLLPRRHAIMVASAAPLTASSLEGPVLCFDKAASDRARQVLQRELLNITDPLPQVCPPTAKDRQKWKATASKFGGAFCPERRDIDIDMRREPPALVHVQCRCEDGHLPHWPLTFRRRGGRCVQRSRRIPVLRQVRRLTGSDDLCNVGVPMEYRYELQLHHFACEFQLPYSSLSSNSSDTI